MHRLAWSWALAVTVAASGCGGATENGTASNTGGTAGGAGAPMMTGGAGHLEPTATGGRAGHGQRDSGSSSGGTSSTDASPGLKCALPIDTRACDGGTLFVHDPSTGTCKNLGNLVCPNNDNAFATLEGCLSACPGSRPDVAVCDTASDCVLLTPGCCGPCEPLDMKAFTSINRARAADPMPVCGTCGACPPVDPQSMTRQYFIPGCLNGACIVVDTRQAQ